MNPDETTTTPAAVPAPEEEITQPVGPEGDWQMTVEEFSFAGCHYNSSCD